MTIDELKVKGITQRNYLWHLDELTDEEITEFLNREPYREALDEDRKRDPNWSDRKWAEFLRDV